MSQHNHNIYNARRHGELPERKQKAYLKSPEHKERQLYEPQIYE